MTLLGTSSDKRKSHTFEGSCLPYLQIARLWEKDGLAAKAIEAPSAEAFREGYEFDIGNEGKYDDLKEELEDAFEELEVDSKVETAWQYKRAYGAGIMLLGTDDPGGLDEKLDPTKVHSLDYLEVFEPIEIVPEDIYNGLRNHGSPEYYRINTEAALDFRGGASARRSKERRDLSKMGGRIHESRLIVLQGIKTSNYLQSTNQISSYFGASVVDRFIESLQDCGVGYAAAGILSIDSSQPVITIEGLMQMVAKNPEKLFARMQAFEMSRSNARAILLGEKEKYERQTTNLSGIPELLDRLSIKLSADIDIPLSVLFGYSPSSLGQPGEVEMKIWYNKIRAMQTRQLSPVLKKIAKLKMRELRQRKIPKKFSIEWHELERMTIAERVEAELNMARRDSMDIKSGMASPDELRKTRYFGGYSFHTNIDESKKAPGFLAPLPAGVVPGSSVTGKPGAVAGGGAHSVRTYARRNPSTPAGGQAAPKQGGDKAPRNRDEADFDVRAELEAAQSALDKAYAESADPAVIKFLEAWLHECELDVMTHGDGDGTGNHVTYAGMQVCVESPRGSTRTWVDTDGTTGSTKMKYDYGYVQGTAGTDGDSVDVYLGPSEGSEWVYVVHQMSKATEFATHDEDKVMLGFDSPNHARDAYFRQYDDERFFGGMSVMSLDDFRTKLFARPGEKVTNSDAEAA